VTDPPLSARLIACKYVLIKRGLGLFQVLDGHGRDRTVVGFTTTCAISAYHH
jgi:hypothetical protein